MDVIEETEQNLVTKGVDGELSTENYHRVTLKIRRQRKYD